jgi:hypothetical protein
MIMHKDGALPLAWCLVKIGKTTDLGDADKITSHPPPLPTLPTLPTSGPSYTSLMLVMSLVRDEVGCLELDFQAKLGTLECW